MTDDERRLRHMLAQSYCGPLLYIDDGELQDNREFPFIDFLRDSVDDIGAKMRIRTLNHFARLTQEEQDELLKPVNWAEKSP